MLENVLLALQLLLICLLGFILRKSGAVDSKFKSQLSTLLLDLVIPCYVIKSACSMEYSAEILAECAVLLVASLLTLALLFCVAETGYLILGRGMRGRIFRYAMLFTNATIFGLPMAESIWGDKGAFFLFVFFIPVRFVYYSMSGLLLGPGIQDKGGRLKAVRSALFSPAILACVASLLIYYFQIQLPDTVLSAVSAVGSCCKPVGMIVVGLMMGDFRLRDLLKARLLPGPAIKCMVMPAVTLLAVCLLHVGGMTGRISVLYAALPTASLLAAYTVRYEGNDPAANLESASMVLISTVMAAFTVPLWVTLAEMFIPA